MGACKQVLDAVFGLHLQLYEIALLRFCCMDTTSPLFKGAEELKKGNKDNSQHNSARASVATRA